MKKFIKVDGLQLINGGYLSDSDGNPVFNADFVNTQRRAEYVVTFAKHAKNKDFTGKKADCLSECRKAVQEELAGKRPEYLAVPSKPAKTMSNKLADEALKFMEWEESSSKVDKINGFLQEFNVLAEFEEFGLFFEDDIVKLNKIYTMAEITAAVEQTIELI
jgi:hypothetical protein